MKGRRTELASWVAANIRSLAKSKGFSLRGLASAAGVSSAQLFFVLGGEKDPTIGWLEKIAFVLDVPVHRLLLPPDSVAEEPGASTPE